MQYTEVLEKALRQAEPATGLTKDELEKYISEISARLKGPLGNAERIELCADRKSLRMALEKLNQP